jgi:hypothetical protein
MSSTPEFRPNQRDVIDSLTDVIADIAESLVDQANRPGGLTERQLELASIIDKAHARPDTR